MPLTVSTPSSHVAENRVEKRAEKRAVCVSQRRPRLPLRGVARCRITRATHAQLHLYKTVVLGVGRAARRKFTLPWKRLRCPAADTRATKSPIKSSSCGSTGRSTSRKPSGSVRTSISVLGWC